MRTRDWTGYWLRELEYSLDGAHRVSEVEKDYYLVGITVTVSHEHPVYRTRKLRSVAGQMEPGMDVTILVSCCEGEYPDWKYLVKLPDGTTGWISAKQAYENLRLPLAG